MADKNPTEKTDPDTERDELLRDLLKAENDGNDFLDELIEATNRATHAVRAIVLPATRILIALLISLPLYLLGIFVGEGGGFLLFLAGAILLGGGIVAIIEQVRETKLSKVPGRRPANWRR